MSEKYKILVALKKGIDGWKRLNGGAMMGPQSSYGFEGVGP